MQLSPAPSRGFLLLSFCRVVAWPSLSGAAFSLLARDPHMPRRQLYAPEHYREHARKCREALNRAKDQASREYWANAENYWLTLANKAEMLANLTQRANE